MKQTFKTVLNVLLVLSFLLVASAQPAEATGKGYCKKHPEKCLVVVAKDASVKPPVKTEWCYIAAGKPYWTHQISNEHSEGPAGFFSTTTGGEIDTSWYFFSRPFTPSSGITVWVKNADINCIY